jgi:hypothetical protein
VFEIFGPIQIYINTKVCECSSVVNIFKREEDIFQRVDEEKLKFVDSDEFITWRSETYPTGKKPKLIELYWLR